MPADLIAGPGCAERVLAKRALCWKQPFAHLLNVFDSHLVLGRQLPGHVQSEPQLLDEIGQQGAAAAMRSEEHTSELQSLMRISYAVFCLKKKTHNNATMLTQHTQHTV